MTTLPNIPDGEPSEPAADPAPLVVSPMPGSRLEQLQAVYGDVKAHADAAAKQLKAVTDAIKVELTALDPDERRFELTGDNRSDAPALRLTYTESWRMDSKRLKAEHPEVYVAYARKSGSWTLRAAGGPTS